MDQKPGLFKSVNTSISNMMSDYMKTNHTLRGKLTAGPGDAIPPLAPAPLPYRLGCFERSISHLDRSTVYSITRGRTCCPSLVCCISLLIAALQLASWHLLISSLYFWEPRTLSALPARILCRTLSCLCLASFFLLFSSLSGLSGASGMLRLSPTAISELMLLQVTIVLRCQVSSV